MNDCKTLVSRLRRKTVAGQPVFPTPIENEAADRIEALEFELVYEVYRRTGEMSMAEGTQTLAALAMKRVWQLEAALDLYGSHHAPCPKSPHHDGYDFNLRCTCGLEDIRNDTTLNRTGEP